MTRVKYLVSMAGTTISIRSGEEREVSDAEAVRLADAGFAEIVSPVPVVADQKADDTGEFPAVKPVPVKPKRK